VTLSANILQEWRHNPKEYVYDMFGVDPDLWQVDALEALGDPAKQRIALQASAGVGKSTILAWAGWYFLTCWGTKGEHPKGAAISITGDNLRDNFWSEMSKWQAKSPFLMKAFTWNTERIYANDHPQTWFLSARSFSKTANAEEQGRVLSGLHSKYVLYLIDESGDINPSVLRAAEQGLSGVEWGKILQAGNPTSHSGMLYAAATQLRHMWHVIKITSDPDDPKRSPRVDIEYAREQIKLYGRENPWVKSYILGEFPDTALNTLLGPDEVEAAMGKHLREDQYSFAQKRLGIDCARFGSDDTVIFPRQGLASFKPVVMKNARSNEIAARVAAAKYKWGSELELVDGTGGFGSGVIDSLIQAGHSPVEVQFSGKAVDSRYANKRAEMWFLMSEWIKRGGALPRDAQLARELTAPTYTFQNGKFLLEPKEQIKKRLGFSPDCFIAGTKILTPNGDVNIEDLKNGDSVISPMGVSKIIKTWVSETDLITTVNFSDGKQLSGKGKHKIFTWDSGWVRLDALALTNVIETACKKRRLKWWLLNLLFTRESGLGFKQQADTISLVGKINQKDFYTGVYGLSTMVQYLRDCIYTIKMGIGAITRYQTLSLSSQGVTCESIWQTDLKTLSLEKQHLNILRRLRLKLLNGTRAQRDWLGIRYMESKHGLVENPLIKSVLFVVKKLKHGLRQGKDFALKHALKRFPIKDIRLLLANAHCVLKNLSIISIGHKNVVPAFVQTDIVKSVKTYNLTLDKENVYYANGVLVANCADALACTFAMPDMPASDPLTKLAHSIRESNERKGDWDPFDDKRY